MLTELGGYNVTGAGYPESSNRDGLTESKYVAQCTSTEACPCSIHDAQHSPAVFRLQPTDGHGLLQQFLLQL